MSGLLIGYARVSTDDQDLTAQRDGLAALGVVPNGSTSTAASPEPTAPDPDYGKRSPPAGRAGDTLVVTKLDRLTRSLLDARDIIDELTGRQIKLNLGGSVHDPTDPVGGCCSTSWPWSLSSLLSRHRAADVLDLGVAA